MGVIKRGILGGFSGKVANVVGTSWKGIAVIKSLPLSVANPQTAGQVNQRNKFTQCVAVATNMLNSIVKPLWDRFAQEMSGYNAFIKANIDCFDSTGLLTPGDLIISRGDLTGISMIAGSFQGDAETADLTWIDNSGTGNAQATDTLFVMVQYTTGKEIYGFDTQVARSAAGTSIELPNLNSTTSVSVWYAWRRADGSKVSDTLYTTAPVV